MKTENRRPKTEPRQVLSGLRRLFSVIGLPSSVLCLLLLSSLIPHPSSLSTASTLRTPSWWRYRQQPPPVLICTNCFVAQPSAIVTNGTGPSACASLVYSWWGCNVYAADDWVWTNSVEIVRVTPGSGPGLYDIYSDCNQIGTSANDVSLTCDTNGFLCGSALVNDGQGYTNTIQFAGCL